MGNIVGDLFVPLFFIAGTGAMFFLAYRFLSAKGAVFRNFGTGLALYGAAFGIWSLVVLTKPSDLEIITTLGVVPFALAHIFFLLVSTEKVKASKRSLLLFGALAYLAVLFLLRTFIYPSAPSFSTNGLFYFNAHPAVVALYIGAFAATLLPAINVVSQKIKDSTLRTISQIGFTIAAIGGIVLVTSVDDDLQTINGWVMGVTYAVLLAAYAFKRIK